MNMGRSFTVKRLVIFPRHKKIKRTQGTRRWNASITHSMDCPFWKKGPIQSRKLESGLIMSSSDAIMLIIG